MTEIDIIESKYDRILSKIIKMIEFSGNTQTEVGESVGMSQNAISRIFQNVHSLRVSDIINISSLLGMTWESLDPDQNIEQFVKAYYPEELKKKKSIEKRVKKELHSIDISEEKQDKDYQLILDKILLMVANSGYSQKEFGMKLGLTQATVSRIFNGQIAIKVRSIIHTLKIAGYKWGDLNPEESLVEFRQRLFPNLY